MDQLEADLAEDVTEIDAKWMATAKNSSTMMAVSYTHLRAHETVLDLVCRLLLEKKKTKTIQNELQLD